MRFAFGDYLLDPERRELTLRSQVVTAGPQVFDLLLHPVRLSPVDPEMFRVQVGMALAHFFAGRFDAAVASAEKAAGNLPSLLIASALTAASHALAGRADEAREAMERLHALDPTMRISKLRDWLPIHRPQDLARFADGLRLAGLPE